MWTAKLERLSEASCGVQVVAADGAPLSVAAGMALAERAAAFRDFLSETLKATPFPAFFWEMPPVTGSTLDVGFEFVLTDAPALAAVRPDAAPFAAHFAAPAAGSVLAFPNLGGDALLIVPRPAAPPECYPHLARFLRTAPAAQIHELWITMAQGFRQRVSE